MCVYAAHCTGGFVKDYYPFWRRWRRNVFFFLFLPSCVCIKEKNREAEVVEEKEKKKKS